MIDLPYERVRDAGSGDMDAFHELYEATSSYVYTLAYRVTQSRADAEDVTQNVYLKLFKNLKSFRQDSSVKTWLYRVTMNASLDHIRKHKYRDKEFPIELAEETAASNNSAGSFDESLLKHLSPEERVCMTLRAVDELSYEEIAANLRVNINTVRTRLRRARLKLITLLKPTPGR